MISNNPEVLDTVFNQIANKLIEGLDKNNKKNLDVDQSLKLI
jgi:hypothetical protein